MKEVSVKKQETLPPIDVGSSSDLRPSQRVLENLGSHLTDRFQRIKRLTEWSRWDTDRAKAFDAYHMVPKNRNLPFVGAANLSSPFPRIGVDAFHANVMASLYPQGSYMKIRPQIIQSQFAKTAEKAARYMEYVINHEANAYQVIDSADKRAQLYGIGYLEPHYVKEEGTDTIETIEIKKEPDMDPETGEYKIVEKKTKKVTKKKVTYFDGVRIESIPVECVYFSPFYTTIQDAVRGDAVFKVFDKNFYEIKESAKDKNGSYYLKSQVDKIEPFIFQKVTSGLQPLEQARAQQDGFYLNDLYQTERIQLAQAYLWYDIDGDDIKEEITATFDPLSGTVLRVCLKKCRLTEIVPRPIDGRLWGEGIPKITENLDDEWENIHNTRSNAGQWANSLNGFYRAGGRFDPQSYTIQPNTMYPVEDTRDIVFPPKQQPGGSYFQEEMNLFGIFERILAVDENLQGVTSKGRTSATETINVSQKSSIRFGNPFNRIVNQINKVIDDCWELSQEHAPPDKEFYVIGEKGLRFDKMSKYDYSAKLKFSVVVSSVFDQQLVRDTMLLGYRLFLVNPLVQQHPEILWELSQKTLDNLDINIKLPPPPQANALSAFEALEMIKREEMIEPEPGIDVDSHIAVFTRQMQLEEFQDFDPEMQMAIKMYIDKCMILKQTLESANLNRSGVFPGMPGQPGQKQPPVTANRNPTQKFNTMRVGESGDSMRQNVQNGLQNVFQNDI